MADKNLVVLLTGGSSGIGAATARLLSEQGMTVYCGSRRGQAPSAGEKGGPIIPLVLDVNDPDRMQAAVQQIVREQGRLDAVVCNAGNGIGGAVEDTSPEEARYQFETCFFGACNTIRACLPVFRGQGSGRIVTVTSVAAIIPIPFQAFYSSVKSALLMLTNALSMEVRPFGIQCGSVLPGDTRTGFTAARKMTAAAGDENSAYRERTARSIAKMEHDEQNGMPPEKIARAILRQLQRRRMRPVMVPRLDYKLIRLLQRIVPDRLMLRIVRMIYD